MMALNGPYHKTSLPSKEELQPFNTAFGEPECNCPKEIQISVFDHKYYLILLFEGK